MNPRASPCPAPRLPRRSAACAASSPPASFPAPLARSAAGDATPSGAHHLGARTFWREYLETFDAVRSTFSRVQDGEVGVLEWTSETTLAGGTDLTYRGASLLDFADDGRVARFATYYDTRVFQPAPVAQAG